MDFGFKGKTAYVYGLGTTGRATAQALMAAGVKVLCWDDKVGAGEADLPLMAPADIEWAAVGAVVKSPGIAMGAPLIAEAQRNGVPVVGDVDLLVRRERGNTVDFIGITGTNGKSTTTALVGHILRSAGHKVAVGGNIGDAALTLPELPGGGVYVLELSSYQLEMVHELAVDGAVFLNLTPDHLARHGTMEAYRDVKLRLFNHAKPDAVKVLGVDQPILKVAAQPGVTTLSVTGKDADYTVVEGVICHNGNPVLKVDFPQLKGPHNAQNVAAALALLVPRWVTLEEFAEAAATFKGLPHRLEEVGVVDGVTFINDSKATNGDSTVYALQSFDAIYWICGGDPKSDGLGNTVHHLEHVRAAFTIGKAGDDFAAQLEALGIAVFRCGTLEKAVTEAFAAARTEVLKGPVVMLSPAAASFDQFRSFEHRGDVFVNCVRALVGQEQGTRNEEQDLKALEVNS